MNSKTKKRQQNSDRLDQQFKEAGDRLVETICQKIRSTEQGKPVTLSFAKEMPTAVAEFFTARAIEITERQGHQIFGLTIDFEPD